MASQRFANIMVRIMIFCISLFVVLELNASRAEDPPQVTCIEVLETGEVTIYWRSLDLTALEFKIFYSPDNITWFQAGSVESQNLDMQYTVGNQFVNANEQIYYFYITAVYASTEVNSNIYNTMFLFADNSIEGTATLLWNSLGNPPPEGTDNTYTVYYSVFEQGIPTTWNLLAEDVSNTLLNFIIPNGICFDSINFKVEIGNIYNCTSISNVSGNWFSETIQPEKPVFDSVSIVNDEYVILGWEPSTSEDAFGTVIYRYESGIWESIDTVPNIEGSIYIDSSYQACGTNIEYAIASMDSCGILSPGSYQTPLRPILFNNISYEICSATNILGWESYINAMPDLAGYEIWVSRNNGPDTLIGQVSSSELTYNHTNVSFNTNYTYYIRAKFGNFSSTSCKLDVTTGNYKVPNELYFANSSALPDNSIEITVDIDLSPHNCEWELFRSDPGGGNYSLISAFNRSEVDDSTYSYIDETADGSLGYYQYYMDVYDSCGFKAIASNTQKTIYLSGTNNTDDKNQLSWNSFEGFNADTRIYHIYRFFGEEYPGEIIDSVTPGINEFMDDISNVDKSISAFNYYVAAVEDTGNAYGYKETSFSNIITFYRETEFYMPNAFRPSGNNSVYKPVTTGFAGSNYLFQIFNRWGQIIFETNDPTEGWDGTLGGRRSPQGTYIYRLTYSSVFDKTISKQGTVMLID